MKLPKIGSAILVTAAFIGPGIVVTASLALSGVLNLNKQLSSNSFKAIWISILLIGVVVASLGYKPISIILFAQVANGILLPVVTLFLLWIMNTKKLGEYRNTFLQNILGALVVIVTLILSGRSLMSAFGLL